MTLNYGIFDASDLQNPDRVYSAALLSRILSKHIRDGIVHGDGGELAVSASDPPAMTVEVATGTAMVQGRFCENDAALTLAVPAADATYARIDRVVVRLSVTPGRTIDILVKKGTPAPSPVPPGLTRTPETWELSLAQISVAAGATMVQAANITDERGNASLCGVAAPVYVPSSHVEVVGAINMQGHALTGLPAPSGATDAARKGYVDEVIGGFGISQIAIDADKDWGGKNITNVGAIDTPAGNIGARSEFVDVAAGLTTLRKSQIKTIGCSAGQTVTLMSVIVPSNYSSTIASNCTLHVKARNPRTTANQGTITVYCNGAPIGSAPIGELYDSYKWMPPFNTTGGFKAGDTLEIKLSAGGTSGGGPSVAEIHIYSSRATNIAACKVFTEAGTW